jgi:hypothetical protein
MKALKIPSPCFMTKIIMRTLRGFLQKQNSKIRLFASIARTVCVKSLTLSLQAEDLIIYKLEKFMSGRGFVVYTLVSTLQRTMNV